MAASALDRLRCERGQSLVLFVGFIGVALGLFALVTDGGEYFARSRQAQNAADAGALAGAQKLCPVDDTNRAACEDSARATAVEYAEAEANMPDGAATATLLPQDSSKPVSSSNPYSKVKVTVSATAPLFFAELLGLPGTKSVGKCLADSPPSPGQCAIASAQQTTKTETRTWTTTTYRNNLFAFAKGGYAGGSCDSDLKITGNNNVFAGAIWSNETLDVPLRGNAADLTTIGTGCSPLHVDDDSFNSIAHHAPIGWPFDPPPLVQVQGVQCLPGGHVTSTTTPDATWLRNNPPGIYCNGSSSGFTLKVDLDLAGYTWVAPKIVTSSSTNTVPKLFSPASGSKVLFYAYGGTAGRCDSVINTNGPTGIRFTGYMIAPNGGITVTTQDSSAIEAFLEGLCLQITGNGTRFTGIGPSPTPVTETHTETVTVPGDVSVALDW